MLVPFHFSIAVCQTMIASVNSELFLASAKQGCQNRVMGPAITSSHLCIVMFSVGRQIFSLCRADFFFDKRFTETVKFWVSEVLGFANVAVQSHLRNKIVVHELAFALHACRRQMQVAKGLIARCSVLRFCKKHRGHQKRTVILSDTKPAAVGTLMQPPL